MELKQETFNEFPNGGIANPNENHMACILLLDTSISMEGDPINSLNNAIKLFKEQTTADEQARKSVDIAIVEFNSSARVVQDFVPLTQMPTVTLSASGTTAMGAGIKLAIQLAKDRRHFYNDMGTPCYKPWIFMITDGCPTDDISEARRLIAEEEGKGKYGKLKFWAVGVPGYSKEVLTSLTKRCIELENASFEGIFNWLSESMVTISDSRVDENPQLSDLPENARVIPGNW